MSWARYETRREFLPAPLVGSGDALMSDAVETENVQEEVEYKEGHLQEERHSQALTHVCTAE